MPTKAGNKIVTDLVGQEIVFDKMPNEEVSEQRGVIRSVRIEDGRPTYTVQMVSGKSACSLIDWQSNDHFKIVYR